MNGIKIVYGNQTKRINEEVTSYDQLFSHVTNMFYLSNLGDFKVNLCYIDRDGEKIEVASNEDFEQIQKYHDNAIAMRIEVYMISGNESFNVEEILEKERKVSLIVEEIQRKESKDSLKIYKIPERERKDSLNVDDILENTNISDSFFFVNQKDLNIGDIQEKPIVEEHSEINKIQNSSIGISIISKNVYNVSNLNENIQQVFQENTGQIEENVGKNHTSLEKGIQNEMPQESKSTETIKIETNESGDNTMNIYQQEVSTQMEKKILVESASECEKICTNEKSIQVEDKKEISDQIKLSELNKNSILKESIVKCISDHLEENHFEEINEKKQLDSEFIISKIEEILSSKMKEVEENFKKTIEIQQQNLNNSRVSVHSKLLTENIKQESNLKIDSQNNINFIYSNKMDPKNEILEDIKNYSEDFRILAQNSFNANVKSHNENEINLNYLDDISQSCSNKNKFFDDEFCSICQYQIINYKFICILCEDFKLCNTCESSHSQHPLIKISTDCQSYSSKEEITKYILEHSQKNQQKKPLIENFKKIFESSQPYVSISHSNEQTTFAMARGSLKDYTIKVKNSNDKVIDEEILIIPINNKNFNLKTTIIKRMNANEVKEVPLTFEAPLNIGEYNFEIHVTMKNKKIMPEPIKITIFVTDEKDVDEKNFNLLFSKYDEIMKLSKEEQMKIYFTWQGVISIDIEEFVKIIKEHKYSVEEALDDLLSHSIVHKNKGDCYYEPHLDL